MREYKASKKNGQRIISMGERCTARSIRELYNNYSDAKARAYNWCREQYCNDENATAFGVGSANTFGFTASWLTVINGENAMRVETKDNSYLVWLDR